MSYVIMKASRSYLGGKGYMGPSCDRAGVEKEKVYQFFCDATDAARKLREVNPVGWVVYDYAPLKEFEAKL